jgi:outer membrane protein assembly factor BamE
MIAAHYVRQSPATPDNMTTIDARSRPTRAAVLAMVASAALGSGCVYRPDIQQGNLLTVEDVEKVTVGMTRSQVRYLLGTPMVSDPFAPQRWDYVYRRTFGRDPQPNTAHFLVRFDGDKVASVEILDVPDAARAPQRARWKFWGKDGVAEPLPEAVPPSVIRPSPDANAPGDG